MVFNTVAAKFPRACGLTLILAVLTSPECGNADSKAADSSGGSNQTGAPAPTPAASPHQVADESKIVLPEYYGVNAIDAGKTIEISPAKAPPDFSGNVEFILYDKSVVTARSDLKLYRISAVAAPLQAAATEIPGDATLIDVHVKFVPNQPEMIHMIPVTNLEPGFYQFSDRVRFYVGKGQLRTGPLLGMWVEDSRITASVITFGMDGTYKMSLFAGNKKRADVIRETGTWTLTDKKLTTKIIVSTDGRPAGTEDVVEIVTLDDRQFAFRDAKTKNIFTFQHPSPEMIKAIDGLERGKPENGPNDR